MKKSVLIMSFAALLFLGSCSVTSKYSTMQMSPVSPVLNIGSDRYDIIGSVEGVGVGMTFEIAQSAAIGAAISSKPDADALIFPKFEVSSKLPTFKFMSFLSPPEYTVNCKAKAIKLK